MPQSLTGLPNSEDFLLRPDPSYWGLYELTTPRIESLVVTVEENIVQSQPTNCTYIQQRNRTVTLNKMELPNDGTDYRTIFNQENYDLEAIAVYCLDN